MLSTSISSNALSNLRRWDQEVHSDLWGKYPDLNEFLMLLSKGWGHLLVDSIVVESRGDGVRIIYERFLD
jgi:hypothetical protein